MKLIIIMLKLRINSLKNKKGALRMKKTRFAAAAVLAAAMLTLSAVQAFAGEWVKNQTGWWYENSDGSFPANGVYNIGGEKYAFNSDGYMIENAWFQSPSTGAWYYAQGGGALATNLWVGDYYVGSDGKMQTDTWIDGYYVGPDGKWVEGKTLEDELSGSASDMIGSAYFAELDPDMEDPWSGQGTSYDTGGLYSSSSTGSGSGGNSYDQGSSSNRVEIDEYDENEWAPTATATATAIATSE